MQKISYRSLDGSNYSHKLKQNGKSLLTSKNEEQTANSEKIKISPPNHNFKSQPRVAVEKPRYTDFSIASILGHSEPPDRPSCSSKNRSCGSFKMSKAQKGEGHGEAKKKVCELFRHANPEELKSGFTSKFISEKTGLKQPTITSVCDGLKIKGVLLKKKEGRCCRYYSKEAPLPPTVQRGKKPLIITDAIEKNGGRISYDKLSEGTSLPKKDIHKWCQVYGAQFKVRRDSCKHEYYMEGPGDGNTNSTASLPSKRELTEH